MQGDADVTAFQSLLQNKCLQHIHLGSGAWICAALRCDFGEGGWFATQGAEQIVGVYQKDSCFFESHAGIVSQTSECWLSFSLIMKFAEGGFPKLRDPSFGGDLT